LYIFSAQKVVLLLDKLDPLFLFKFLSRQVSIL